MGMDLYAGTFTRYYARNWKTRLQQWAEENQVEFQTITPDSHEDEEESPSPEEIQTAVEKWRDHLLEAIRAQLKTEVISWREDNTSSYYTDKPDWIAFEALLLYLACKKYGEPLPEKIGKGMDFEDFEISKRTYADPEFQWSLVTGAICWLPIDVYFTFEGTMPDGNEGHISTTACLLKELEKINAFEWNADEQTIKSWSETEGYNGESRQVKPVDLPGGFQMYATSNDSQWNTESLAKYAYSIFYQAAKFGSENRVPVLMDF